MRCDTAPSARSGRLSRRGFPRFPRRKPRTCAQGCRNRPSNFGSDRFRISLHVDRVYRIAALFIYAVLAAASGREKWDFMTEPEPAGLRASISISEEGTASGGNSANRYENAMASVPLYRLFWARVEYMLSKRPDWVTCEQAAGELKDSNTNAVAALGGLCGPTSDGRNAPAPEPLPPLLSRSGPVVGPQASRAGRPPHRAPDVATPGTKPPS
jgi:hypothetical protein